MGRKKKESDLLTDFELRIMNLIWILRSATAADIVQKFKKESYAYTTISTIMRNLEKKEILSVVKNGKTHIYVPEISREEYQMRALNYILKTVFGEDPTFLMQTLLGSSYLRPADVDEIKYLLRDRPLDL
jgi:predicted transcriptional regulator